MKKYDYRMEAISWADEGHKVMSQGDNKGAINLYRQAVEYARKGNAPTLARMLSERIALLSV
jgi:hypothetical protein